MVDLLDALVGLFLLGYGVYLHHTISKGNEQAEDGLQYLYVLVLVLGGLLSVTSCLSFVGITFAERCSCLLCFSSFTGILIGLFELVLLLVFGTLKSKTLGFLDQHRQEFGLDEADLDTFKGLYVFFLWLLAILCLLELVRYKLSTHLRRISRRSFQEDYQEHLLLEANVPRSM